METHTLDASQQPLGRLAARAAVLLMGKHRPTFRPHRTAGERVIIVNADRLRLTGRKWREKRYFRHSGYIGNLRETTAAELVRRDSRLLVRRAVSGMLPKNTLRPRRLKNLSIYKGAPPHS